MAAALALLTAALVTAFVPACPGDADATGRRELRLFAEPQAWLTLLAGAIGFGGMFALYSYIAEVVTEVGGLPEGAVPVFLLAFGLGMVAGTCVAGALADWSVFHPVSPRRNRSVPIHSPCQDSANSVHRRRTDRFQLAIRFVVAGVEADMQGLPRQDTVSSTLSILRRRRCRISAPLFSAPRRWRVCANFAPVTGGFSTASVREKGHIVRAGLNYRFGWEPAAPVVARY